jgi:hypothetical protein
VNFLSHPRTSGAKSTIQSQQRHCKNTKTLVFPGSWGDSRRGGTMRRLSILHRHFSPPLGIGTGMPPLDFRKQDHTAD